MQIQKILFPNVQTCTEHKMYFKGEYNTAFNAQKNQFLFNECGFIDAFSYFNGFSIDKWLKYTILDNLALELNFKGSFSLEIHSHYYLDCKVIQKTIFTTEINTKELSNQVFTIPLEDAKGILSFKLIALSADSIFAGGSWNANIDEQKINKTKIAINICTFKREKFIEHNVKVFNEFLINNENSALYKNLEIFISDNAQSLSAEKLESEHVHIFKNKNLGGSGGFTRAMIETLKAKSEKNITHVLMMDDDVRIDPNAIEKTYMLLALLKDEYKDAYIAGAMVRLDLQNIQHEKTALYENLNFHALYCGMDLTLTKNIVKNEVEQKADYAGWWYCCMPISVLDEGKNLPYPLFIRCDDVEFSLRNAKKFLSLNGICVWHEFFDLKDSPTLKYYENRNRLIIGSCTNTTVSKRALKKQIIFKVGNALSKFRYRDAEFVLWGVLDFLKGFDYFKNLDGEKLNKEIMSHNYKKVKIEELDPPFNFDEFERTRKNDARPVSSLKKMWQMVSEYYKKSNRIAYVPAAMVQFDMVRGCQKVYNYEQLTNMVFVTEKSRKNAWKMVRLLRKTLHAIDRKYNKVCKEFYERKGELTNLNFWNEYLTRDGESVTFKSVIK